MSKKSRRRNKRLLALAGLAGAVALSRRKAKADLASTEDGKSAKADRGINMADIANTPKKDTATIAKPIVDTKPTATGSNVRTRQRIVDSSGNTVESAGMRPNVVKGILPPSQNNMYKTNAGSSNPRRAGLKSGGRVKGCGIAKRGFGKAMKKGKK